MQNNKKNSGMTKFESAVRNTPDIAAGYKKSIQAFGANSSCVQVDDTRKLEGSVDIDKCTRDIYPDKSRWDYALGYDEKAYFIEVHPASTSDVATMIAKSKWLKEWLKEKAKDLEVLKANDNYYWLATGKIKILPKSRQYRMLMENKILLRSKFKLPLE